VGGRCDRGGCDGGERQRSLHATFAAGIVSSYVLSARFLPGPIVTKPVTPLYFPEPPTTGIISCPSARTSTSPRTVTVPPGSDASPAYDALCVLVYVKRPWSEPTRAPEGSPNCFVAFSSRSRDSTRSPSLTPFGGWSTRCTYVVTEITSIVFWPPAGEPVGASQAAAMAARATSFTPIRSWPAASRSRRARRGSRPGSRSRGARQRARRG